MTDNVEFEGIDSSKTKSSMEGHILEMLEDLALGLKITNYYLSVLAGEEIQEGDVI